MLDKEADLKIIIKKSRGADIPSLVVQQIIALITDGTLKPGDKLPSELEMTRRFDISRISLREAIKLLEAKGYISSQGRRGKFICSVTDIPLAPSLDGMLRQNRDTIHMLTEARKVILGESAALAAGRAKPEDFEKMNAAILSLKSAAADEYLNFHASFFSALSFSVRNTVISHLNVTLTSSFSCLDGEKELIGSRMILSRGEIESQMESIVEAIRKGVPEEARHAVQRHFDHLTEKIPL
jgi:GntR family transcriptional repressor for pyruvate dehydrogenase complex